MKTQGNVLLEIRNIQEGADEALVKLALSSEESEQGVVLEEDKL